ncbi:MAG: lipid-A-disaccharide synthase [Gemmatimonadales bacterium]
MKPGVAPRILVSAGEPSGDLHGSRVVAALRARYPDAAIEAIGGPRMAGAGARILFPMERLSAFGFVEIIGTIPTHYRLLRQLRADFLARRYDLVIVVDYPGFHLRVAEAAHRAGIKVLYYIAPQLWAWRPERARRFAGAVDRMAVILPFEQQFFGRLGLPADYVGHPLMDRGPWPQRAQARQRLGLGEEQRVLAIFPGSRTQEIDLHWPLFRGVALQLLREGRCHRAIVAGTEAGRYPDAGPIEILRGDAVPILSAADAALAKSGTTTLEAALAGTPMVVAYLTNPWTYVLARLLATVEWISLVNLVAEREIVPEFWKRPVRAADLTSAIRPLLDANDPLTVAQRAGLAEVSQRLGSPGAAARVAAIAGDLLGG